MKKRSNKAKFATEKKDPALTSPKKLNLKKYIYLGSSHKI